MKGPMHLAKKTGLLLQALGSHRWFTQGNCLIIFVMCINRSGKYVENRLEENTKCRKLLGESDI